MNRVAVVVALIAGLALGWLAARIWPEPSGPPPREWVARIGPEYITEAMFVEEMQRRGGRQPGQYQTLVQKRALLDDMLFRHALVQAARKAGVDQRPELRRTMEQLLANQFLQDTLRAEQQAITVTDDEVRAHYAGHATDYTVPGRRRIAMVQILVPDGAGEEAWQNAMARGAEALEKARAEPGGAPHFGTVAREYSQDQASRYRGGVIGWITDGQRERYRFDDVVLEAAQALQSPGEFSPVLRGADGVYVVRLVEIEPQRERALDELADGIRQRLLRERLDASEQRFRAGLLEDAAVQIREATLAQVDPLAPAADPNPPKPPAMPADQE
jgi:peptidyl-prolyl cis-trans isomerase C